MTYEMGDVEIVKFNIVTDGVGTGVFNKTYDLRQQATIIDIYEGVMNPFQYATIRIVDSIDLLRQFPIITEESIILEIRIPGMESSSTYNFKVKAVTDISFSDQLTSKSYTLHCITEDFIRSARTLVNEPFKEEIHKAVTKILKDSKYIGTQKQVRTEETKGVSNLLITRKQPYEAIDMLRRRAVSAKNGASSYCFFENKHGYYFYTLEKLFQENSKQIGNKQFTFSTTGREDITKSLYRNIIAYQQIQSTDAIDKIQEGGFRNRLLSLDFVTGKIQQVDYTPNLDPSLKVIPGKQQNTEKFRDRHQESIPKIMLVPFNSFDDDTELPRKISTMQAYAMRISQSLSRINIWGDCNITAGDVISCAFPVGTKEYGDEKLLDRLTRDNFLVFKARHTIQLGARPLYTQALELISGSFFEEVS